MAKVLSDAFDKQIKEHIRNEVHKRVNALSQTPPATATQSESHQAPEIYIAKPQSSNGIPAITLGEEGAADQPGSELCDVYQIVIGETDTELIKVGTFQVKVYNFSPSAIAEDYVSVIRDKFGFWTAVPQEKWRWFELAADLDVGSSAEAFVLEDSYTPNEDSTFTVHDTPLVQQFGWAKSSSVTGARGIARLSGENGRWEIVSMQRLAMFIDFTIIETDSVGADDKLVSIQDFYQGQDPTNFFTGSSSATDMKIFDPQGLFPGALTGAKGKARFDDRSKQYHVDKCQQMATQLKCISIVTLTTLDVQSSSVISISSPEVMNPIDDQDPTIVNDDTVNPLLSDIKNTFDDTINSGDIFLASWNKELQQWEVSEIKRGSAEGAGALHWAIAAEDWKPENAAGPFPTIHPSVQCIEAYPSGNPVDGSVPFNVLLPRSTDQDPAIYTGNILIYGIDIYGAKTCTSDYMNGKISDVRMITNAAEIPEGWEEMDGVAGTLDMRRRVPMGRDLANESGDNDENAINKDGGFSKHGLTENNHASHEFETQFAIDKVGNQAAEEDPTPNGATEEDSGHTHEIQLASRESMIASNVPGPDIHVHAGPGSPRPEIGEDQPAVKSDDTDNRMRHRVLMFIQRVK